MRIDSHQHYWRIDRGDYGWLTPALAPIHRDFMPEDLAPLMKGARIDRSILVQAAPTLAETRFLLDLAKSNSGVAGVVGWVDFDAADVAEQITALSENWLLVGLRPMIHDIADPDWMLSPAVGQALAVMERQGLVFDALIRPVHLTRLDRLAGRYPDLTIVIDHAAKPLIRDGRLDPWRDEIAALAARPNVVVKLSGMATEAAPDWQPADLAPYVDHLFACFGPRRILWGSDWPVLNLAGDYGSWVSVVEQFVRERAPAHLAEIMGHNAERIYLAGRGRPCD